MVAIDLLATLQAAGINAISQLIGNVGWIILFVWGFKTIAKEIREGVKQIPHWISQYSEIRFKQMRVEWAKGIKK